MTDREKVIDGLNETISYLRLKTGGVVDRCIQHQYDALELLKEQEPGTPDCVDVCTGFDGTITRQYFCGACGHEIMKNDRWQTKYCPNCGKAVKWDA